MKSKFIHLNAHLDLRWKTDLHKPSITENLDERQWEQVEDEDDDWNFYWASVGTVKKIFNPKYGYRLTDDQ